MKAPYHYRPRTKQAGSPAGVSPIHHAGPSYFPHTSRTSVLQAAARLLRLWQGSKFQQRHELELENLTVFFLVSPLSHDMSVKTWFHSAPVASPLPPTTPSSRHRQRPFGTMGPRAGWRKGAGFLPQNPEQTMQYGIWQHLYTVLLPAARMCCLMYPHGPCPRGEQGRPCMPVQSHSLVTIKCTRVQLTALLPFCFHTAQMPAVTEGRRRGRVKPKESQPASERCGSRCCTSSTSQKQSLTNFSEIGPQAFFIIFYTPVSKFIRKKKQTLEGTTHF